jgi:hypothetical protein
MPGFRNGSQVAPSDLPMPIVLAFAAADRFHVQGG